MKPSRKQVLDAAARLQMQAPLDWFKAAGGGFGPKARNQLEADIRTLVDHALENDTAGFDAA